MAASYRLPPTFVAPQGEFKMPRSGSAFGFFDERGRKMLQLWRAFGI